MKSKIDHNGVVESIEGNHIKVRILQASACSACQAKALCASSDTKEKIIDVWDDNADQYHVGENVVACGSLSMGRNAVYLAFLIPLVLIILAIYYLLLSALKDKLSKTFSFWIEKLQ